MPYSVLCYLDYSIGCVFLSPAGVTLLHGMPMPMPNRSGSFEENNAHRFTHTTHTHHATPGVKNEEYKNTNVQTDKYQGS